MKDVRDRRDDDDREPNGDDRKGEKVLHHRCLTVADWQQSIYPPSRLTTTSIPLSDHLSKFQLPATLNVCLKDVPGSYLRRPA